MAALQRLRRSAKPSDVAKYIRRLHRPESVKEANIMVSAWGRVRSWQEALQVVSDMPRFGLRPNAVSFNAAITACGKAGQWEAALRVLHDENLSRQIALHLERVVFVSGDKVVK